MHKTTIHNPIRLVHRDGDVVHTFNNFNSLIANWPLIRKADIGKQWKKEVKDWWRSAYAELPLPRHEYALIDSFGDFVDPDTVRKEYDKRHPPRHRWWERRQPGSKRSWRFGGFYRRPKTTQERRWNEAWDDEDDAPSPRARRNNRNLPDSWDDALRNTYRLRSWKHYRRHQWKD